MEVSRHGARRAEILCASDEFVSNFCKALIVFKIKCGCTSCHSEEIDQKSQYLPKTALRYTGRCEVHRRSRQPIAHRSAATDTRRAGGQPTALRCAENSRTGRQPIVPDPWPAAQMSVPGKICPQRQNASSFVSLGLLKAQVSSGAWTREQGPGQEEQGRGHALARGALPRCATRVTEYVRVSCGQKGTCRPA